MSLANHAEAPQTDYTAFTMHRRPFLLLPSLLSASALSLSLAGGLAACSSTAPPGAGTDGGGNSTTDARVRPTQPIVIDAGACKATITAPPILDAPHVEIGTAVTYNSNPPSSGPHYPLWAAFREYDVPVDRRYYVHNLEHGGVVLAYKCATAAECPDMVEGLRKVIANIKTDPLCKAPLRVRYVLTPDPLLATKVAIAAWGYTYTADCLDVPTLSAFANDNYAQGPEDFCTDGNASF